MKVRKFRILRLRHHVSMVELGRACGVSAQRISELELSENKPSAETVQKIQSGFEAIIAQRGEKLGYAASRIYCLQKQSDGARGRIRI